MRAWAGQGSSSALVAAGFIAGIAAGVRIQTAALTVPLLIAAATLRTERVSFAALVRAAAAAIAGVLIWAVPLVVVSGGPTEYLVALGSQAGEDFEWVRMWWKSPTDPRVAFHAIVNSFAWPWGWLPLGLARERAVGDRAALDGVEGRARPHHPPGRVRPIRGLPPSVPGDDDPPIRIADRHSHGVSHGAGRRSASRLTAAGDGDGRRLSRLRRPADHGVWERQSRVGGDVGRRRSWRRDQRPCRHATALGVARRRERLRQVCAGTAWLRMADARRALAEESRRWRTVPGESTAYRAPHPLRSTGPPPGRRVPDGGSRSGRCSEARAPAT